MRKFKTIPATEILPRIYCLEKDSRKKSLPCATSKNFPSICSLKNTLVPYIVEVFLLSFLQ